MAATKRIPVQVDEETYSRARDYSESTGVPIARVIDKAVNEYLDKHATAHVRALAAKK